MEREQLPNQLQSPKNVPCCHGGKGIESVTILTILPEDSHKNRDKEAEGLKISKFFVTYNIYCHSGSWVTRGDEIWSNGIRGNGIRLHFTVTFISNNFIKANRALRTERSKGQHSTMSPHQHTSSKFPFSLSRLRPCSAVTTVIYTLIVYVPLSLLVIVVVLNRSTPSDMRTSTSMSMSMLFSASS